MNAARELTSAISMLRAPTPKVDITVLATRDLLEMDLTASVSGIHFFSAVSHFDTVWTTNLVCIPNSFRSE